MSRNLGSRKIKPGSHAGLSRVRPTFQVSPGQSSFRYQPHKYPKASLKGPSGFLIERSFWDILGSPTGTLVVKLVSWSVFRVRMKVLMTGLFR